MTSRSNRPLKHPFVYALVLGNIILAFATTTVRAEQEVDAGCSKATALCWCKKTVDTVGVGTCGSLFSGKACGGANVDSVGAPTGAAACVD